MLIRKFTLSAAAGVLTFVATSSIAPPTLAADRAGARSVRTAPASIERLRLATPLTRENARSAIDPVLLRSNGSQQVLVRFRSPSVAESSITNPADGIMRREQIRIEQGTFVDRVQRLAPGARMIAEVQGVLNAVVLQADSATIRQIAADPSVARVSRVIDYKLDLSETVPYITARKLQSVNKGNGVKVAVLDSGIDYTHAAFGGPGTAAAYEAAYGTSTTDPRNTTRDGLFPTARVVRGHDFVGEAWPNGELAPDPDPIDCGPTVIDCAGSHGTHVADIIGGTAGVAPKVRLWAVKVCSAVTSSCSGVALLQGMEYAADPNGDGDTSDRADIINMSLGSPYGQPFDDDLATAVQGATKLGILTVASAGNSGDKPYVTGSPGAAPSALSVAQTEVPSAFQPQYEVTAPADIAGTYPAVFQPWSVPLAAAVTQPLQYGDGSKGNRDGCAAFQSGSLAGRIVLVDRGGCTFGTKIANIGGGGGTVGIIGMVTPDAPFPGASDPLAPAATIPGYMISQADSDILKSGLPETNVKFDPNLGLPLVMSMASTSSRGPSNYYNAIKPEIGAPGASVSALAGTGTGTEPFGGTSGAAPMVTGSAALVLGALPNLKPFEVKARLMNNAERQIFTDVGTGRLAEITRIGSGEVRAYRAWADPAAAWNTDTRIAALSFGQVDASQKVLTLTKRVSVRNYSDEPITYAIRAPFRFADDRALGAVKISTPDSFTVPAHSTRDFPVTMTIYGDKVRDNQMNSGSAGADPGALTFNEIDGYLVLDGGSKSRLHLPWHVLPRKAADVTGNKKLAFAQGVATATLRNNGVGTAQNDAYALLAVSPNQPKGGRGEGMPTPDIRAVGINTYPVPAGFCSDNESFLWAFAIDTWERQTHSLPVAHFVSLDINRDGDWDYDVVNLDGSLLNVTDGRQLTWAINRATGTAEAFFYAEHATNTGNTVLLVCGEQVGLTGTDMLATNVDMMVETADWYFGGPGDVVTGLTVTPYGERYFGVTADVPGNSTGSMDVYDFGLFPGNTDELGVLLFTNGARAGSTGGATRSTEALQFKP